MIELRQNIVRARLARGQTLRRAALGAVGFGVGVVLGQLLAMTRELVAYTPSTMLEPGALAGMAVGLLVVLVVVLDA